LRGNIRYGATVKPTWLLWLVLGPITGPLVAFAYHFWRKGQWLRAGLCGLGVLLFWLFGPALLLAELNFLTHLH
jgi:hypothetical protein